jgi:hypothetical protein
MSVLSVENVVSGTTPASAAVSERDLERALPPVEIRIAHSNHTPRKEDSY